MDFGDTCTLQFRETKKTTQKTEVDTQMTNGQSSAHITYVILIFYLSYTCLINILYLSYTDLILILLSYYVGNEYLYWAKHTYYVDKTFLCTSHHHERSSSTCYIRQLPGNCHRPSTSLHCNDNPQSAALTSLSQRL